MNRFQHLNALLGDRPLRQRGFVPKLADSEVITMEVVGEFFGIHPQLKASLRR